MLVCFIGEATTLSGSMLHKDMMTVFDQLGDTSWSHAYTTLTLLDLFWNSYLHRN